MAKILEKLMSGRYFATLAVVTTYCATVGASLYLTLKGSISTELFMGIFTGFSGTATLVIKSYFDQESDIENSINGKGQKDA